MQCQEYTVRVVFIDSIVHGAESDYCLLFKPSNSFLYKGFHIISIFQTCIISFCYKLQAKSSVRRFNLTDLTIRVFSTFRW